MARNRRDAGENPAAIVILIHSAKAQRLGLPPCLGQGVRVANGVLSCGHMETCGGHGLREV